MKKLCMLVVMLYYSQNIKAQNATLIDKERLLEYYQTQRYADAAKYLKSIYNNDTQDIKAINQMAYCNLMDGNLPEAELNYLKIYAQQPTYLPAIFNLANINTRRGNYLKAINYLQSIVKLDSNNFNAYKQLANLITTKDSLKLNYLKKANALKPTEADIAIDLATQYQDQLQFNDAYQTLNKAILADTSNAILLAAILPNANKLKKYSEVITIGEKLLQNGSDANVAKDVGMAYFFTKNYQKCINLYKKLEDIGLQTETILYYLSLSYRAIKNYEMATIYAKKTIEEGISINIISYYTMLGAIYEEQNQFTAAANAYKKGLTFGATSGLYYQLAILYDIKLNQKRLAKANYNLYLKSKPNKLKENELIVYAKSRILALKN